MMTLEWNDEIKFILGRPCFVVAALAKHLKKIGKYDIPDKAEDEQAAAIHWMLSMYEKYGDLWRDHIEEEIGEML